MCLLHQCKRLRNFQRRYTAVALVYPILGAKMSVKVKECVSVHVWHIQHSRHHMAVEKRVVLLARFHHQGESCQLLCTCIDVHACEIVEEYALYRLFAAVTLVNVEVIEQVESLVKDVATAASEVGHRQFLQPFNL